MMRSNTMAGKGPPWADKPATGYTVPGFMQFIDLAFMGHVALTQGGPPEAATM